MSKIEMNNSDLCYKEDDDTSNDSLVYKQQSSKL